MSERWITTRVMTEADRQVLHLHAGRSFGIRLAQIFQLAAELPIDRCISEDEQQDMIDVAASLSANDAYDLFWQVETVFREHNISAKWDAMNTQKQSAQGKTVEEMQRFFQPPPRDEEVPNEP